MSEERPTPQMIAAAERVLEARFGARVRLVGGEVAGGGSGRARVFRVGVQSTSAAPKTVIAKYANVDDDNPWLPDKPGGRADTLFNEWAGLQLLTELASEAEGEPLTPRLFGGDRDADVIAMEDLGKTENVLSS